MTVLFVLRGAGKTVIDEADSGELVPSRSLDFKRLDRVNDLARLIFAATLFDTGQDLVPCDPLLLSGRGDRTPERPV